MFLVWFLVSAAFGIAVITSFEAFMRELEDVGGPAASVMRAASAVAVCYFVGRFLLDGLLSWWR